MAERRDKVAVFGLAVPVVMMFGAMGSVSVGVQDAISGRRNGMGNLARKLRLENLTHLGPLRIIKSNDGGARETSHLSR
jgi:hypothetical protein